MTELIIALLMIVHGEIKEARIQPTELEKNIDGSLSIKKLILE